MSCASSLIDQAAPVLEKMLDLEDSVREKNQEIAALQEELLQLRLEKEEKEEKEEEERKRKEEESMIRGMYLTCYQRGMPVTYPIPPQRPEATFQSILDHFGLKLQKYHDVHVINSDVFCFPKDTLEKLNLEDGDIIIISEPLIGG